DIRRNSRIDLREIEPRHARFHTGARGNDDDVGVTRQVVIAGIEAVMPPKCGSVGKVERLAFRPDSFDVDDHDLRARDRYRAEQSSSTPHQACADDDYLRLPHLFYLAIKAAHRAFHHVAGS